MDELSTKQTFPSSKNKNEKEKEKMGLNIKKCAFCRYFINCCCFIIKKEKKYKSNYPIILQFLITIVPIVFISLICFIYIYIYLFYSIFKFNYYSLIKDEYLEYLITDIEDINFELNSNEIKNNYEEVGNILFFKLYFEELISLGLLDEDKVKIFPNISDYQKHFINF